MSEQVDSSDGRAIIGCYCGPAGKQLVQLTIDYDVLDQTLGCAWQRGMALEVAEDFLWRALKMIGNRRRRH